MNDSREQHQKNFSNWDRRSGFRAEVRVRLRLESRDTTVDGWLKNISTGGMFVECTDPLPVGSACSARIRVLGDNKILNILHLEGEVIRVEGGGMAIRFDNLPDKEHQLIQAIIAAFIAQGVLE